MAAEVPAVIPYIRAKHYQEYESPKTKLYVTVGQGANAREKKITIRTWGATENEDVEHFLEFIEIFRKEMTVVSLWNDTNTQNTQVAELFECFDQCLRGTAQTDWYEILGGPTPAETTWRAWKDLVP